MQEILLVIQILVAIALVAVILVQRSEGGALGIGGGGMMSARGTANFLTRATAILATIFLALTLALAILASRGSQNVSVFDEPEAAAEEEAAPAFPALEGESGDAEDDGALPLPAESDEAPAPDSEDSEGN